MILTSPLIVGETTGPVSGKPPPPSIETKNAIREATKSDTTGQHVSGIEDSSKNGEEKKVLSEKELERKRRQCTIKLHGHY